MGLTGIEVFDEHGRLVSTKDHVADIRLLHPDSSNNNHSSVWNLVDSVNITCDDHHSWLTAIDRRQLYKKGEEEAVIAVIEIQFCNVIKPSLIRVFNFNKSRTHSFRGVRKCCLRLDDSIVFKGYVVF